MCVPTGQGQLERGDAAAPAAPPLPLAGGHSAAAHPDRGGGPLCTPLSSHFIPNPVFVPRQARDKHGKIETMSGVFSQVRYTAVEPRGDGHLRVVSSGKTPMVELPGGACGGHLSCLVLFCFVFISFS
jgi:hypothetical protein